jgi:hypothetical protein
MAINGTDGQTPNHLIVLADGWYRRRVDSDAGANPSANDAGSSSSNAGNDDSSSSSCTVAYRAGASSLPLFALAGLGLAIARLRRAS